jgi:hypothetical protein
MEATDPSDSYEVGEVTLEVGGVPIAKGKGATGAFVFIGQQATPYNKPKTGTDGLVTFSKNNDPRRDFAITLLKSSDSNDVLRTLKRNDEINTSIVVKREDGGAVLEAGLINFEDGSPRDVGHGECRWDMKVAVRSE